MSIEKIYIPTLGRATPEKQYTYKNLLSEKYQSRAIFVIQESEKDLEFFQGKNTYVVPNGTYIDKKRELITKHAGDSKFAVFDDDLSFYWKPDINVNKKEKCDEQALDSLFDLMSLWLDSISSCGLGATYTPYKTGVEHEENFRICLNVFYNGKTLPKDKIDWLSCPCAEDFFVTLQLMEMGHSNKVSLRYLVSTIGGTNTPGGASLDRNLEKHNASMEFLKKRFPEAVSITYEQLKDNKMGQGLPKAKAHIQWKKMYKLSEQKRKQLELFSQA